MRRRADRILLVALCAGVALWALRGPAHAARRHLRGAFDLAAAGRGEGIDRDGRPAAVDPPLPLRIAHAGGAYHGLTYTNSIEALDLHYAAGTRWFEMDFLRDEGGRWWAVHEWSDVDASGPRPPPLEQVLRWFEERPSARLITDTKDDNRALLALLRAADPALRARIHPQIYRFAEDAVARAAGLGAPVFTTYKSTYPWWAIRAFARRHHLLAVTVRREEAPDAARALGGTVPVLTWTINDPADHERLLHAGVAGIYTDLLLP